MRNFLSIMAASFKLAMQELGKNKLRTFLSLFGVTIGIFCIIGVLATVNSLEENIQREIKTLGTNTIYVDKWDYSSGGGPDYPWWKYVKRPVPNFTNVEQIKSRSVTAAAVAFMMRSSYNIEASSNVLNNSILYGITEDFNSIQPVEIQVGRYISPAEFHIGSNSVVIGNEVAEKLFAEPVRALGRTIEVRGKMLRIIGVMKKQGSTLIGGWQFDKSTLVPYRFAKTFMNERRADPLILVKGKENLTSVVVKDELTSIMRSVHQLKPLEENDFTLNDVNDFSDALSKAFVSVNIGGWAIGGLAFIVGIFGVANIMFVTVKERTSQIGLKKAIGAKNYLILSEFLLESAFLCILGGILGLLLVYALTQIATRLFHFPFFLSPYIITLALVICIIAGILAGIIPARQAAKLDPVQAIRS